MDVLNSKSCNFNSIGATMLKTNECTPLNSVKKNKVKKKLWKTA
jgi:hypothetical protein